MATKLHLAHFSEQSQQRHQRRTNRRTLFVAAFVGVAAFCAGWLSAPRAAEWHAVLHTVSAHHGEPNPAYAASYNEANWGLGARAQLAPAWSAQAGAYRNSYRRTSVYALADWTPLAAGPLRAGLFGGVATGYPYNDGRATVAGGLVARAQGERLSIALRLVPRVSAKQTASTVAVEFGWRV
jgi:hypothetical protein